MPIGKVFGRTSTTSFKFSVEAPVNKWDYVAVNHPDVGLVLNQVVEIEKVENKTYAQCIIVGYRTDRGFLRQPRTPYEPGTEVIIAEDDLIKAILDLRMNGIYMGYLQGKKIKAFIDPKKLITKHLAILAKSGAGKSYAVGVILEELIDMGIPIILIDPHGEYSSIKGENTNPDETKYFKMYDINGKGFANNVMEFAVNTQINIDAHQIRLPVPNDPFSLVETMPFKVTDAQRGLLYNVVNDLVERKGRFEFDELIKELEISESTAKWRLIGGIQQLEQSGLFSHSPTPMVEMIKPGQISIINFKGASIEIQEIVARSLLTKLFEDRKMEIVPPCFLVIDEAHNYCPERGFGETRSSKIIRTIASEGRKFGLGLTIISQRPARVDKSVMSQCSSQIVLQVTNPNDLTAISRSFEGITSETESEIKNLPIGKSMIIGATAFPIFVDIRVRKSQHGGAAKSFDITEAKRAKISTLEYSTVKSNNRPVPTQTITKSIGQMSIFEPRISRQEIETMESDIKDISLILKPVLSTICQKNNKNFQLIFDLETFGIIQLNKKLSRAKLNSKPKLPISQNKVMSIINQKNKTPLSEVFVRSGLAFTEVNKILNQLVNSGQIRVENKIIYPIDSPELNFEKMNFILRPKFINLDAEKRPERVSEQKILGFLKKHNITLKAKRKSYIPFYKIETENETKIIDSLSYSMRL